MSADTTTQTAAAEKETRFYGLVASFDKIDEFLVAVAEIREAGFSKWDTHTPFVVHGLDAAMGIKPTKLPFLVFGAGLTGCAFGIGLQWFTNAYDYPFLISGKPLFSLPANIPVAFEMTILFAAISALVGMLAFNGLPQLSHPLHSSRLGSEPRFSPMRYVHRQSRPRPARPELKTVNPWFPKPVHRPGAKSSFSRNRENR